MKQNNGNIFIQTGRFINVIDTKYVAQAAIYNESERKQINLLIHHNFLPHHTAIALKGKVTKKHWNIEKYRGKYGIGFILITTSYVSRNARHITYFLKNGVAHHHKPKPKPITTYDRILAMTDDEYNKYKLRCLYSYGC